MYFANLVSRYQNFYIGEFFSFQILSSIILIALCLQNCAQKKMRKLGDLGNSD